MAYIKCNGELVVSGSVAQCSEQFINSQPDYDVLLTQLVVLNDFDPIKVAGMVIFCFVVFISGFATGLVINYLRSV